MYKKGFVENTLLLSLFEIWGYEEGSRKQKVTYEFRKRIICMYP
jgi:hypothetical protein